MSYTGVIIPTVDFAVDNSGTGVWRAVWRMWTTVDNRGRNGENAINVTVALWTTARGGADNDDARRTTRCDGRQGKQLAGVATASGWS